MPPVWSFRHPLPTPEKPPTADSPLLPEDEITDDKTDLEVVCLVQMPCSSPMKKVEAGDDDDDDERVPVVEFGILQARSVKEDRTLKSV